MRIYLALLLTALTLCSSNTFGQSHDWKLLLSRNALFTTCVELNPRSAGRIVYGVYYYSSVKPMDLVRSDDAGQTWQHYPITSRFQNAIHQIFCLPSDTSVLFALGDSLFRSSDGGHTWSSVLRISSTDGETLTYHALSNTLYFTGSDTLHIWKSQNNGVHWQPVSPEVIKQMTCTIAVSPAPEATLLAGGNIASILRSNDQGINWNPSLPQDNSLYTAPEISKLLYVPAAPHSAMAACWESSTRSLLATTNDGITWTDIKADSAYIWALEIDPDPSKIINGLPQHFWTGLLWETKAKLPDVGETIDGGKTWTYSSFPDENVGVWVLKYSPESHTLFAASSRGIYSKLIGVPNEVAIKASDSRIHITQSSTSIGIEWGHPEPSMILTIRNILGETVVKQELTGRSSTSIDKHNLSNGCYFCEIRSTTRLYPVTRILIQ